MKKVIHALLGKTREAKQLKAAQEEAVASADALTAAMLAAKKTPNGKKSVIYVTGWDGVKPTGLVRGLKSSMEVSLKDIDDSIVRDFAERTLTLANHAILVDVEFSQNVASQLSKWCKLKGIPYKHIKING